MNRTQFTIGKKMAAAALLFATGISVAAAHGSNKHDKKGNGEVRAEVGVELRNGNGIGAKVKACLQERRTDGYFDRDLTREERLRIRNEFRACIRAAIFGRGSSSSSSSNTSSSSSRSSKHMTKKVEIEDFAFDPQTLTIKQGTTVKWKNKDDAPHTVTSTMTGGVLNSGRLDEGETYSHTFTGTGTYDYLCTLHPNMKGKIIVTE